MQFPRTRRTDAFERRVAAALGAHITVDSPLVVACSGGPDSVATLIATTRWASARSAPLTAACFDHGLRPPSETLGDRRFVESLAGALGVRAAFGGPFSRSGTGGGSSGGDSEAEAREARYGWLATICAEAGASVCVTGHTMDDQAETVLLRLTRGAGTRGAGAMRPAAPWPVEAGRDQLSVVRPLLGVRRSEVLAYLDELGVEARTDSTNELLRYSRNRIRQRVLPELTELNPRAVEAIARFAELASRDDEALDEWAAREVQRHVVVDADAARIDRVALRQLPSAVAVRMLRQALGALGLETAARESQLLIELSRRRGAMLSLRGGEARVEGDVLVLRSTTPESGNAASDPRALP